jgi:hypothetical protein
VEVEALEYVLNRLLKITAFNRKAMNKIGPVSLKHEK